MPTELLGWYLKLPVFLMVASRLAGLLMFQPILSALAIPARARVLFVLALAAITTPLVPVTGEWPDTAVGLALALGVELLLGFLVGLVMAIGFVGVQMGGTLIAQESGLAFGQIVDPSSDEDISVLSVFYMQLAVAVYLIVGGHRVLLSVCLDTFQTIPLLAGFDGSRNATGLLLAALSLGFVVSVRVAAPAVLTLFLVNLALGFISRTVPQLNIVTVGFTFKALVGFVIMAAALPAAMAAFTDGLELSFEWLSELVGP